MLQIQTWVRMHQTSSRSPLTFPAAVDMSRGWLMVSWESTLVNHCLTMTARWITRIQTWYSFLPTRTCYSASLLMDHCKLPLPLLIQPPSWTPSPSTSGFCLVSESYSRLGRYQQQTFGLVKLVFLQQVFFRLDALPMVSKHWIFISVSRYQADRLEQIGPMMCNICSVASFAMTTVSDQTLILLAKIWFKV